MSYSHTQHGFFHYILWILALSCAASGFLTTEEEAWVPWLIFGLGSIFALLALSFTYLRIEDEGHHLAVRFGPVPIFKRTIRYAEMECVRKARSAVIDGWGIHWIPGRGWTFNLWGFDCVEVDLLGNRLIRLGSNDADNLAAFLETKVHPEQLQTDRSGEAR